jgi:hypothetical protein
MTDTKETKPVGYIFDTSYDLGNGKTVAIHGNFPVGFSAREMSAELDIVFDAMDHQRLKRLEIPAVRGKIEEQKNRLQEYKDEANKLVLKQQADRMTSAEKSAYESHLKNIEIFTEAIEEGEVFLADLEAKAA